MGVGEHHSRRGQPVDVAASRSCRARDSGMHVAVAEIVAEDIDDVRPRPFRGPYCRGPNRRKHEPGGHQRRPTAKISAGERARFIACSLGRMLDLMRSWRLALQPLRSPTVARPSISKSLPYGRPPAPAFPTDVRNLSAASPSLGAPRTGGDCLPVGRQTGNVAAMMSTCRSTRVPMAPSIPASSPAISRNVIKLSTSFAVKTPASFPIVAGLIRLANAM